MDNNQLLNNSINNSISNVTKAGIKSSKNIVKTGTKLANNVTKKNVTNASTKYVIIPLLIITFIACIAHNPSATLNYTNEELKNDSYSDFFDYKDIYTYTSTIEQPTSEETRPLLENILNIFLDDGEIDTNKKAAYVKYVKKLSSILSNTNYTGDSLLGQGSLVYKNAFETVFNYIYSSTVKTEIDKLIKVKGYDSDRTLKSYNDNLIVENNINFAEIIAVMSQGGFTLNKGTLDELFDLLKNENIISNLYSLTVTEKPLISSIHISEETISDTLFSENEKSNVVVGDVISDIAFPLDQFDDRYDWNDLSGISDLYDEIIESDIPSMEDEINERESALQSPIMKKDRTILLPCKQIPKIRFITYCTENELVITPKELNINGMIIPYKIIQERTTYTTEAHITYIYGDITINPYTLSDLYKMFGVNPYDYSVDFPTKQNYELLNSVEMGIRTYSPDINFGTEERTPFNNTFSSFELTNDDVLDILASYESNNLSILQKSIIDLCASCDGTKYTQPGRMGGPGKGFDCSSYASWVYAQLGIYFSNGKYWEDNNVGHAPVAANICKYLEENGCKVLADNLQVGDLVFWDRNKNPNGRYLDIDHVAIYVGNGMIYEASGSAGRVRTREIYHTEDVVSYCRPSLLLQKGN